MGRKNESSQFQIGRSFSIVEELTRVAMGRTAFIGNAVCEPPFQGQCFIVLSPVLAVVFEATRSPSTEGA